MVTKLQSELLEQQRYGLSTLQEALRLRDRNYLVTVESVGLEEFTHPKIPERTITALKVSYSGIYGYIPKDLMDDYDFRSLQSFIGGTFQVFIQDIFKDEVSEQSLFIANRKDAMAYQAETFWKNVREGYEYDAFVSGVDRTSMWLIIEGARVRMSREEYSYKYQRDLQLVVFLGDTIRVKVTQVDLSGEEPKVRVSRRVLEADPKSFLKDFKVGSTYAATIENVDFERGIFVSLKTAGASVTALASFPSARSSDFIQEGRKVNFKVQWTDEARGFIGGILIIPQLGQINRATGFNHG